MNHSKTFVRLSALAAGALLLACGQTEDASTSTAEAPDLSQQGQAYVVDEASDPNILQVALGSPDHTTLVAAVQAAGLENVLVNQGPLTVFAPTDAAFAELPEGTVEELVKPENQATLSAIVTSHAAPGTYAGDLLTDGYQLYMATGHMVDVEVRDDGTYVNGAKILATVQATNGVVHVVDKVFLIAAN
jgi:uncharacterized surface protein with fasciclin (FAS1) repeats